LTARFTRYTLGSVAAAATSAATFALLYGLGAGTTACSVSAFIAGAVVNWFLNRRWAWQRRGRPDVSREVVAYAAISAACLVAASAATAWTRARTHHEPGELRLLLVTGSYLAVFGLLFVLKFAVYEVWVFSGRRRTEVRSRHQVPITTRANRTP
jgi:putative flippase GtrA